jgi:hypothetical protein
MEKGTVDAETYVEELIDGSGLIPDMNAAYGIRNWTLMQDGASAHTARNTLEYLRMHCNLLEEWTSGSPDLNPIENLWAIVKKRIAEVGPATLPELINVIIAAWNAISPEEVANLTHSMPNRLQKTVEAEGGPNGY